MKLLIVGGVAGGASAAARARRLSEGAHIVLFERGPDVSFANCGLLKSEKDGRKAYYGITEPHLANIMACIEGRFGG